MMAMVPLQMMASIAPVEARTLAVAHPGSWDRSSWLGMRVPVTSSLCVLMPYGVQVSSVTLSCPVSGLTQLTSSGVMVRMDSTR